MRELTAAEWDASPELKKSIRAQLINWAWHHMGGLPELGYPDHQPFTTPPDRARARPAEYLGVDDAEKVERIIRTSLNAPLPEDSSLGDLRRRVYPLFHAQILRYEYVKAQHLPQRGRADKLGLSRSTYLRRVDDAELWFCNAQRAGH